MTDPQPNLLEELERTVEALHQRIHDLNERLLNALTELQMMQARANSND